MPSTITVPNEQALQLPSEAVRAVISLATAAQADINSAPIHVVRGATTAALPACTYSSTALTLTGNSNGALATQDGLTMAAGERILVKNQATGAQNGIYVVTAAGDTGSKFVLTRADDCNSSSDLVSGELVVVSEGTVNADKVVVLTTNAPITLDTTALAFARAATSVLKFKHPITTAATATIAEIVVDVASEACTVVAAKYFPSAASTPASGSNNIVLLVNVRDGAGGAAAQVASATLANATPMAAMQAFDLGTITNGTLAAGNVLTFTATVTGTATLPTGFLLVTATPS